MNWYKKAQSDIQDRLGKCYALSGRFVLDNENAILMHGSVTNRIGDGRTINHAWVEYDNKVFDAVLGREFDKQLYYALFDPKVDQTYDHERTCLEMLRYSHWGPWNEQNPPKKPPNF